MRTWENYKYHVKSEDFEGNNIVTEMEGYAEIIGAIISKRLEKRISQRDLADRTRLSTSTISQIESLTVVPTLGTLLIILNELGLKITICDL